jgi:hypothetical protein
MRPSRWLLLLLAVLPLRAHAAVPTAAVSRLGGNPLTRPAPLLGTVARVDAAAQSFDLTVRAARGSDATTPVRVKLGPGARITTLTPGTQTDLVVGRWVQVLLRADRRGQEKAAQVTVLAEAPEPAPVPRRGVAVVENAGTVVGRILSLTPLRLRLQDGSERTLLVTTQTHVSRVDTVALRDLAVGTPVSVMGVRKGAEVVATGVTVVARENAGDRAVGGREGRRGGR